jgi:uncharacterized protein involved in tolerance to divalent cations
VECQSDYLEISHQVWPGFWVALRNYNLPIFILWPIRFLKSELINWLKSCVI